MTIEIDWVDKYSPKVPGDLLIPNDTPLVPVKDIVNRLLTTGTSSFSGFVLYGNGGSGKTCFVNVLKQLSYWQIYTIPDTGAGKAEIDDIEKEIELWTHPAANSGKTVLIVCNEFSKSSKDFRDGLRGLCDRYRGRMFVIATDNDIEKLKFENPQLVGFRRLLQIDWDLISKADIVDRCSKILKAEGYWMPETYERLTSLVSHYSPDIGTIIQMLQMYVESLHIDPGETK